MDCVVPFVSAGGAMRPAAHGTLMIRYEANTPHPTIRRLKAILAASTVVRGWLIGGTILIVVYFLVLRPIRVMAQIVRARSSGARHLLMPAFRKGEIGELAQSFNRMIVSEKERRAVNDKLTTLIANHKLSLDKFAIVSEADAQGRITYVNDLFCEIAKYSREELIGRDHRIVNSGYHPKSFFKEMWTCIGSGRIWRGEIMNRAKDGTIYWVDGTIIPFMAPNGKPEKYLSIRVPITERKLLEDQIIEQKKMVEVARAKSAFLSVVSHELRTPLAVIREGVDILQEDSTGPLNENQKKFAGMVTRNVDRLMNLINDLLDLQKLEAKAMELRPEPTQLAEVIREAVEGIGIKAQTADVRIINEALAPLPIIRTDPRRIQQVLYNLIGNAIKFSPKDTEIRVRSVVGDNYVRVEVADQAGGIRPEDLPKLFLSFSQLGALSDRKTGSSGLGLAISKEIVTQLNGQIDVTSEFGKGSVFYFTLPITG